MPITPVRMLQNVPRNISASPRWTEHLILPIHLISHHLIFIYLDMSSINYRDTNSRKEQSLFRLSQNFESHSDRDIGWCFWRLDEKVAAIYWYQWRVCRIKIICSISGFRRITHSGDATVRVEHPVCSPNRVTSLCIQTFAVGFSWVGHCPKSYSG
jgi:hypothetical protein